MKTKTQGFRKGMAGLALVGVTALGVGVAGAANAGAVPATASSTTKAATATTCPVQLRALHAQWWTLQGKIDVLQRERNVAIAHGRYDLAARLERAILDLQARQAVVRAKIVVLEQRCG